jgi:hypothetical protein
MKPFVRTICFVVPLILSGACGNSLADITYEGDPMAIVQGALNIEPTTRPNQTLQVTLVWAVEGQVDYKTNQDIDLQSETFGFYKIDLLVPPPDSALNVDPETGGKIGFAHVLAYDDPRGEGPVDLSNIDPSDYATLVYRFRGGSPNVMLGYARDSFGEGSNIAENFGTALSPGFFLVRFDGDCLCPISDAPCHNSLGKSCYSNTMSVIPIDTHVDLTIVDDISTFGFVPPPSYLFF